MAERPLLPLRWRKLLLVLHIAGGVGWMGLDVGLLVLAMTGLTTQSGQIAVAVYTAFGILVPPAVLTLSLLMLVTGLMQGLWTKWGLLKYWWVIVKLVVGLVLTALVLFVLVPAVEGLPAHVAGMRDGGGQAVRAALGNAPVQLMFPPVVSFLSLAFALVLSVYKPWGRIRSSRLLGT
jgi:hypothetical protein